MPGRAATLEQRHQQRRKTDSRKGQEQVDQDPHHPQPPSHRGQLLRCLGPRLTAQPGRLQHQHHRQARDQRNRVAGPQSQSPMSRQRETRAGVGQEEMQRNDRQQDPAGDERKIQPGTARHQPPVKTSNKSHHRDHTHREEQHGRTIVGTAPYRQAPHGKDRQLQQEPNQAQHDVGSRYVLNQHIRLTTDPTGGTAPITSARLHVELQTHPSLPR